MLTAAKFLLTALVVALLAVIGLMAFVRRDHKVELVVSYAKSPPESVWRLLTDHASEPQWLPVFGSVVRQPDVGGREVWTHSSPDRAFNFTVMTVSAIPERRYERLLLRDGQPRSQSWDGRWVYELERVGDGTRMTITEYGWTDGFPFFFLQRVVGSPDTFLKYYATQIGRQLNDPARIEVRRSQ